MLAAAGCDLDSIDLDEPAGTWSSFGLEDVWVNELDMQDGTLYAATEEGMYRRNPEGGAPDWEGIGLHDEAVIDFAFLPNGEMLAVMATDDTQADEPSIYRWSGFGEEWESFQQDYGGEEGYTHIEAIVSHPAGRDTVFARGSMNVAKSTDGGTSWRSVYENWDANGYQAPLIYFHPADPARMWAGGENSIFQPYLLRSSDYGETWEFISIDAGGDNAVYAMITHPETEEILVGMEGRIIHSTDEGESWETVFEPETYAYILDMELHAGADSDIVYASGSEEGTAGGPLTLYRSTDFGETWTRIEHENGPSQSHTEALVVTDEGSQTVLYLGTDRGVFRYAE